MWEGAGSRRRVLPPLSGSPASVSAASSAPLPGASATTGRRFPLKIMLIDARVLYRYFTPRNGRCALFAGNK